MYVAVKCPFLAIFMVLASTFVSRAQVDGADSLRVAHDALVEEAGMQHRSCHFVKARDLYAQAVAETGDSTRRALLDSRRLCAENGIVMSAFVHEPVVVSKHVFPLDDFFLYYPMLDRSWRMTPNVLDSLGGGVVNATYVPEECDEIYFSKKGPCDVRNIYRTRKEGEQWTMPSLINEGLTSSSDDIFPVLSPDGKKLFFASSGLYGVGGYDLYVSEWNEARNDWDDPVNMGFPYSSPFDDFLYMDTPDGRYSIFASNRECSRDSVCVYVLEFDNMPVRKRVDDEDRLAQIMLLHPSDDQDRIDNGSSVDSDIPENEDTRRYADKVEEVRALKDSVARFSAALDDMRMEYAASEDGEVRAALTESILNGELHLPEIRSALKKATAELQKIEMDFLFKGVIVDPDRILAKADRKVVGRSAAYTFTRMNPGPELRMEFQKPVSRFDYSFKVLSQGQYAEDQTLPAGVVYQIHFVTLPASATISQLKGLSPVFETVQSNGNHFYTVGLFSGYADALENLNAVKKLGFKSASIVAFKDGKPCSLSEAKAAEKMVEYWQVTINPGGGQLPPEVSSVIRGFCDKDISKNYSEGIVFYVVSPFSVREDADELAALIRDAGIEGVSVSRISED